MPAILSRKRLCHSQRETTWTLSRKRFDWKDQTHVHMECSSGKILSAIFYSLAVFKTQALDRPTVLVPVNVPTGYSPWGGRGASAGDGRFVSRFSMQNKYLSNVKIPNNII